MTEIRLRVLLRPALAVLVVALIAGALVLFKINWVAAIVVPVVVAVLTAWFVQRFPQLRQPVVVTTTMHDVDFVWLDGARIPASGHSLQITVETAGPLTVVLDQLRPVQVSRASPAGQLMPHLGVVDVRPFEVLLDHDPPILRPIRPDTGDRTPVFPFTVAANDPEVFNLTVLTETGDVRWYLELDTVCLGRRRTTRIDLAGQPFRTIARPQETSEGRSTHAR